MAVAGGVGQAAISRLRRCRQFGANIAAAVRRQGGNERRAGLTAPEPGYDMLVADKLRVQGFHYPFPANGS